MKLTKYVHACLLIETDQQTILCDPGEFSWKSGLFSLDSLQKLDSIVITHEHFDHFDTEFVHAVIQKFPEVCVVSTPPVLEQLHARGLGDFSHCVSNEAVQALHVTHESMDPLTPGESPCENMGFNLLQVLTHPGDSLKLTDTKPILALPLAGPWESAIEAIRLAMRLRPQYIIPIHDWMWNEQWRDTMYRRLEAFFQKENITFLRPIDGQTIELKV